MNWKTKFVFSPALSLGERENCSPSLREIERGAFRTVVHKIEARRSLFPLLGERVRVRAGFKHTFSTLRLSNHHD